MTQNYEIPTYELQTTDLHWDREAACFKEELRQFYARSRVVSDPAEITRRFCEHCPVASDCLTEAIKQEDMNVEIVAGMTRAERKPLINQVRLVKREQAKKSPDPNITLNGVIEAIAAHITVLRTGTLHRYHPQANQEHDSRWQGNYSKRSPIDPDRIASFYERFGMPLA